MLKSKFLNLLRTLNHKEISAFQKHLHGSYGNEKIALAVFDYIHRYFPRNSYSNDLEADYAYRQIFGMAIQADKRNRKKLFNTLADLHKWLKEFLLFEKVRDGSLESQALWLVIAKQRRLEEESAKQLHKIRKDIECTSGATVTDMLLGLFVNYYSYYQFHNDEWDPFEQVLLDCLNDLDLYYSVIRMKLVCEIANLHKLEINDLQLIKHEFIQRLIENKYVKHHALLELYEDLYLLITQNDENLFYKLQSWFYEKHTEAGKEELSVVLSYLHNFAAGQFKKNKPEYAPVLHRLNQYGVENDLFMHKGTMSPTQFNNIINIACSQSDFEWAHYFISEHNDYLETKYREDTKRLAHVIVFFHENKFEDAYNLLYQVEFASLEDAVQARIYAIRCLYELKWERHTFVTMSRSIEKFLRSKRDKRPHVVIPALNFIRLLRLIFNEKTPNEKLIEKIKNTAPLYLQGWLLNKMEGYKGRYAIH